MSWFRNLLNMFAKKKNVVSEPAEPTTYTATTQPSFEEPLSTASLPIEAGSKEPVAEPEPIKEEKKPEVKADPAPASPVAATPTPAPAPAPAVKKTKLLTITGVNFREKPVKGTIIRMLPKGSRVTAIGEAVDGWYQVEDGVTTGYVSANYLAPSINIDLTEELVKEAEKWIGVEEKGGNNKGPEVERFQKAVDGKAMAEAWCMAFVQFCLKEVCERFKVVAGPYASEHCLTVWNKSMASLRLKAPEVGALVIWQMEGTTNGHTGIVKDVVNATTFKCIEGNTGPEVGTVNRDGDGVYVKTRTTSGAGKMLVKGYIQPFSKPKITIYA